MSYCYDLLVFLGDHVFEKIFQVVIVIVKDKKKHFVQHCDLYSLYTSSNRFK